MVRHDAADPSTAPSLRGSRTFEPWRAAATALRAACVGGLITGAACSLSLGLDDKKACTTDSECEYSTGQGTCDAGFCQPPGNAATATTGPNVTDGTTSAPGSTDDGMVDVGDTTQSPTDSTGSTSTDTGVAGCMVNTDCDMDQRCNPTGACVDLLSEDCAILQYPGGDFDRDSLVFIGSIMPSGPPFDSLVVPLQNATQLAIEDFNNITNLPGNRKIGWVGCDSTTGAAAAESAARHLVDDVGVPAIVGPVFSEAVIQVADQVTVPGDVFVITPTGSAEIISGLLDQNLVWRVTPSDVYQSSGILDRMLDLAPDRVLVLVKDDAYGNGILGAIQTDLITDLAPVEVTVRTYENPANFKTQEDLLSSYGLVIGDVFDQVAATAGEYNGPGDYYTHVLILGTSEAEALIVPFLATWAQFHIGFVPTMPEFIVSHGVVPSMEQIVENLGVAPGTEALAPLRPALFANLQGTSPDVFDPENFTAFNIRYKIRFMDEDALTTSSLSYDATLAALFAMVTVDADQPVTGSAIAEGMASLSDAGGTAISFSGAGLTFIQTARNLLAAGSTIDLQGVSGALDWDPQTGELRSNILGWDLAGTPDAATLNPARIYILNAAPATDGNWIDVQ